MSYKRSISVLFTVIFLSGCQLDTRSSVDDYTGADAAKIRVLDRGIIGLVVYEPLGNCYKEVDSRKLTSTFHLSLIDQADQSVGSTKSIGMQKPGKFQNKVVKEYSIKSGQYLAIVNTTRQETYSGATNVYNNSTYFIPEKNHEYEIHVEPSKYLSSPASVTIDDLTSNDKLKEWKGELCKKTGFFS
ncbi:Uncharacterised protein [Yersinia frederiksenii]|uniref:Lipoprotein n=2 Tax=Yersinia frederiksenii TaxID=29484 RepID=A0A380PXJ9_YERFR|nr:hypothetical protein [Yersinia frederiksenii]ATM97347.1 hypothetical protein CRN75_19550 [Yersinia frederiksenii]KGA46246.1 hypothetical protein DJ58_1152 [Yersinia frederiksenii ATCC 33641]SUP78251.1 Uncharacterised protein [Yersinia frederiksenii]